MYIFLSLSLRVIVWIVWHTQLSHTEDRNKNDPSVFKILINTIQGILYLQCIVVVKIHFL